MKRIMLCSLFVGTICISQAQDQTINGATFKVNGNVGIGTVNPQRTLSIQKNIETAYSNSNLNEFGDTSDIISLQNTGNSAPSLYTSIFFRTKGSSGDATGRLLLVNKSAGSGAFTFHLRDNSHIGETQEKMRLDSDGNLGIGNSNPSQALVVQKSIETNYSTTNTSEFGDSSDIASLFNSGNTSSSLFTSLFFRNEGNSGIASGRIMLLNHSSGSGAFAFHLRDNSHTGETQEKMRLDSNGNLGIGTTDTKGFKLGVNGKIAATEVKVATYSNWSDFVFRKGYQLPTLRQVEEHIRDKGHLKNIPSAEEVHKNGFFLAQMNAKLLQKIEELTLYTIEQEKKIESQNIEITKLQKETKLLKSINKRLFIIESQVKKLEKHL
ncbi:MAG: hypothetical protein ABJN84_13850 [Flavobacteriaceae bacterium]